MVYEWQYIQNLKNILCYGTREMNARTGVETLRLPFTKIIVDLEEEFPILLSKKVFWKSAVKEILWIMQKQSNKTSELDSKIWDAWTGSDGTIGKAYGYQVAKPTRGYDNQISYILNTLKDDPSSRECIINMWNVQELTEMNLVPCAYSSIWSIINGKLNCMLVQRSADYPLGVPFNTLQYAVLTHLFARHLNVIPGKLTHVMADSHIYVNQIEGVNQQLEAYWNMPFSQRESSPKLTITGSSNFWEVKADNIHIENYDPMPAIKYELSV